MLASPGHKSRYISPGAKSVNAQVNSNLVSPVGLLTNFPRMTCVCSATAPPTLPPARRWVAKEWRKSAPYWEKPSADVLNFSEGWHEVPLAASIPLFELFCRHR